jgi:hypothetical protein
MTVSHTLGQSVKVTTVTWETDECGDASEEISGISGEILKIVTIPGEDCDQPDDDYDVVINDEDGLDIALGLLANRDEATAEAVVPVHNAEVAIGCNDYVTTAPQYVSGVLTLVVSNASTCVVTTGTVRIYWR